ncbi:unnamed protein product [Pleuronectes platessa]|uniref:Uncharacterized protein n=1 Tax=Pleuronectes platessa TaxID=8262 RepID=A0A9N7UJP0_PLEPL|nr:unnamed protein product [Pleuronectes platessa]
MLPVSRGILDLELDAAAGPLAIAPGGPAAVRAMKRGDPEPDAQTAAALTDLPGAECKRPRIDATGAVVADIGQVFPALMTPLLRQQSINNHPCLCQTNLCMLP